MTRKVLAMVSYPLVGDDLAIEFRLAGWEVVTIPPGGLGLQQLREVFASARPRALVTVNYSPQIAWASTREGVPYVSWTVDPLPQSRLAVLEGTRTELVFPWLHRAAQVDIFRALGLEHAAWLPLAAPRRRFSRPSVESRSLPATFVGSSLRDELKIFASAAARWGLDQETRAALEGGLEPLVDLALEDPAFAGFGSPQGLALPASLLSIAGEPAPMVAEALDAFLAARLRRRRVALADAPLVHGDEGWMDVVGERWRGPLRDGQELSDAYAESLANLDVPRLHQRDIATLRALDVAAVGGCLVAEPSADLVRLLEPGTEFLAYRNTSELDEALARVRRDPAESLEVGRRAAARVAREHSLELRAAAILEAIERI